MGSLIIAPVPQASHMHHSSRCLPPGKGHKDHEELHHHITHTTKLVGVAVQRLRCKCAQQPWWPRPVAPRDEGRPRGTAQGRARGSRREAGEQQAQGTAGGHAQGRRRKASAAATTGAANQAQAFTTAAAQRHPQGSCREYPVIASANEVTQKGATHQAAFHKVLVGHGSTSGQGQCQSAEARTVPRPSPLASSCEATNHGA
mmetsp:Transcript_109839/g.310459  ORF Transcript_109839/g.310459 Transcript_109839/m.310459 type:complete len:202 (+) Transcript_109839:303-908(+)